MIGPGRNPVAGVLVVVAMAGCGAGLRHTTGTGDDGGDEPDLIGGGAMRDMAVSCSVALEFACGPGLVCDPCSRQCVPPANACALDGGGDGGPPADLVSPADLAPSPDLLSPSDFAAPPDLSAPPDAKYAGCQPQVGLAACYSFEEVTGQVLDGPGNGNHGATEGAGFTRGVPGRFGSAIAFNGSDGRVHVPASHKLDFATAATVEFWIKLPDWSCSVNEVASRGTGNNDDTVSFWSSCGNGCGVFQHPSNGGGVGAVCSANNSIKKGAWSYVAIRHDGQRVRSYIDGKLLNDQAAAAGSLGPMTTDLYIGRRVQGIFAFNGSLDELRWWTVARTEQEMCADGQGLWQNGTCTIQ